MNAISLILFNLVFIVCNYYPKHILEADSPYSIIAVIINLLFFFVFAVFLVIAFNENKYIYETEIFSGNGKFLERIKIKKILLIVGIQCVFDIFALLFKEKSIFFSDVLTFALWLIFYFICVKEENNIFLKHKSGWIKAVLIAIVIADLYLSFKFFSKYNAATEKYIAGSAILKSIKRNCIFEFEVKNFFFDSICGAVLMIFHKLLNVSGYEEKKTSVSLSGARVMLLLIIAFVPTFFKTILFNYSCFSGINVQSSGNITYQNNEFGDASEVIKIYRRGTDFSKKLIFQIKKNNLLYNNYPIFNYSAIDELNLISETTEDGTLVMNYNLKEYDAEGTKYYLYKNDVICFRTKKEPAYIYSGKEKQDYSEQVLNIYKKQIEDNNWIFFESGSKYLLKYDSEFINHFLKRFSKGNFTAEESESLKKYNFKSSYIKNLSKKLLD